MKFCIADLKEKIFWVQEPLQCIFIYLSLLPLRDIHRHRWQTSEGEPNLKLGQKKSWKRMNDRENSSYWASKKGEYPQTVQ